jgi:CheY-like chemotaxis protein
MSGVAMFRTRLLVVDDDESVANLICRVAEDVGFDVRSASGIAATEMCKEFEPDVIVLDIFMPDIDGFEIMRYLAEEHVYKVPIVILSGQPSSYLKMAEGMGNELGLSVVANISKPFSLIHLHNVLKKVMKQSGPLHRSYAEPLKRWLTLS